MGWGVGCRERRKPRALKAIQTEGEGFPLPPHPEGTGVGCKKIGESPTFGHSPFPRSKGRDQGQQTKAKEPKKETKNESVGKTIRDTTSSPLPIFQIWWKQFDKII